mgnify:CR=1 FL=1
MIKGIILDFDGLIIDTESAWYEALDRVFETYQVKLPFDLWVKCVGASHEVFDPYQYFAEHCRTTYDIEDIKERVHEQHSVIMSQRELRPGVVDYLQTARSMGLRVGIASSSHLSWIKPYLQKFQIESYIESIRCADYVKRVKPDPEVYKLALQSLELQPEETIAFEDSPNGAKAAYLAGLHVVTVPNEVTERLQFGPHSLRLKSMSEMPLADVIQRVMERKQTP